MSGSLEEILAPCPRNSRPMGRREGLSGQAPPVATGLRVGAGIVARICKVLIGIAASRNQGKRHERIAPLAPRGGDARSPCVLPSASWVRPDGSSARQLRVPRFSFLALSSRCLPRAGDCSSRLAWRFGLVPGSLRSLIRPDSFATR